MKLLFDENLSFKLCQKLNDLFPGSSHVRLLGLERADDQAIWDYAKANEFVLVTLDADFAEMAGLLGPPPRVIRLRCGNQATTAIETLLRDRAVLIVGFGHDNSACLEIYLLPGGSQRNVLMLLQRVLQLLSAQHGEHEREANIRVEISHDPLVKLWLGKFFGGLPADGSSASSGDQGETSSIRTTSF